ncbi:plasmid replication/partition related protein [Xylophilus sp.]|uniref:plasmid replication/partition related protein n=1 Tax=Xylophilus sp. TaxID=2653893 RepID=UPI0013B6323E|nr:plasmid replication/partition related protein [Xylophilus sp.]KAF1043458.1 MAG: hypothetical protein GAK38_03955 [Xylophilus sp.]
MTIVVDPDLQAYIDPLTPEECESLERSLLAEGCRDALVLWGEVLVDGHNRYRLCQKHGLPFQTVQNPRFRSIEDVHLWMIDQHLGRRSVSDFQRGILALRRREIEAARRAGPAAGEGAAAAADAAPPWEGEGEAPAAPTTPAAATLASREAIARAARISSAQVGMIEKIRQRAAPEVVAAVKAGTLSINAAAAVATLPAEEQAAAAAGGKDELRQAAKRVREARRKPRAPKEESAGSAASGDEVGDTAAELVILRRRVAELAAENEALRAELERLRGWSGG